MTRHQRIHTRVHKCNLGDCGETFAGRAELTRHKRGHSKAGKANTLVKASGVSVTLGATIPDQQAGTPGQAQTRSLRRSKQRGSEQPVESTSDSSHIDRTLFAPAAGIVPENMATYDVAWRAARGSPGQHNQYESFADDQRYFSEFGEMLNEYLGRGSSEQGSEPGTEEDDTTAISEHDEAHSHHHSGRASQDGRQHRSHSQGRDEGTDDAYTEESVHMNLDGPIDPRLLQTSPRLHTYHNHVQPASATSFGDSVAHQDHHHQHR